MSSKKNIRATAFHEFWGEEYPDSVYLWQGAKHNDTLAAIENSAIPTHKDKFSTQDEIKNGHEFCKSFYYRILPELAGRLNYVHNLDLSVSFWQMAFGYWLYRHISVVYDKYVYLSALNIEATSIKLLSEDDFYIPQNHLDYLFCFAGDFGVQQLVSQYYYLFKTKDFAVVNKKFTYGDASLNNDSMTSRLKRKLSILKVEPQIVLLGAYFSENTIDILDGKSHGRIGTLNLPVTDLGSQEVDFSKRRFIANSTITRSFECYFMQTLHYCLPKDILENFMVYHNVFKNDIKSKIFTHIVSEDWISNFPNAIYIAFAKEEGKSFLSCEHGAGRLYCENGMQFIDRKVADKYISIGWKSDLENFIQGGFVCRDAVPYKYEINNRSILYVTTTKFIYLQEFNEFGMTNSAFIRELKVVADFVSLLPSSLKENFLIRPRRMNFLWDVEKVLQFDKNHIRVDRGNYTDSILKSRIVVIDHMSTGFAEILQNKVPFLLVYDINTIPLRSDVRHVFNDLVACGVIHTSAHSAATHLSAIYEDIEGWWNSELIVRQVSRLIEISIAPASRTTDFLLSLLSEDSNCQPTFQHRFWALAEVFARRVYRLMNKIKSLIASRIKL